MPISAWWFASVFILPVMILWSIRSQERHNPSQSIAPVPSFLRLAFCPKKAKYRKTRPFRISGKVRLYPRIYVRVREMHVVRRRRLQSHDRNYQLQSWFSLVPHILFAFPFCFPSLHSCSGVMDLVVAKRKNCWRDAEMALRYVVRQEFNCDLMEYVRVKALELNSSTDEVIMLDGEVFPGPNPFRFVCIPCLLTVFGEYFSVCNKHTTQSSEPQTSSSQPPATLPSIPFTCSYCWNSSRERFGSRCNTRAPRHRSTAEASFRLEIIRSSETPTTQRITSIRSAHNVQRSVGLLHQPGPARAEETHGLRAQLLDESIVGAPLGLNGSLQGAILQGAASVAQALQIRAVRQNAHSNRRCGSRSEQHCWKRLPRPSWSTPPEERLPQARGC